MRGPRGHGNLVDRGRACTIRAMRRSVVLALLVACGTAPRSNPAEPAPAATSRPFAPSALDKPAFEATPAELRALAEAQPANEWAILRDEHHAEFDERGTVIERKRTVFLLGETEGFSRAHDYDASTTDPPAVRARLIRASGAVVDLAPTDLVETEPYADAPSSRRVTYTFGDASAGDVIEELVTRTVKPRVGRDNLSRHIIGWVDARVLQTRSVYSAPLSLDPAHLALVPDGAHVERAEVDGRRVWTWELGPLDIVPDEEWSLPQETASALQIVFSAGATWNQLAASYLPIVDGALAQPLTWPAGLAKGRTRDAATAIARWVSSNVTTSHLDADQGGLAVRAPAQTVQQGGSNLDRAVLLVALLRAAGIPADLALADRTGGLSTFDAVPSLLVLDHPLVRARPDGREQWFCIDVDPLAHGQLLQDDRDRSALVIAATTHGLVRTPASTAADHTSRQVRTFTLADEGPGTVHEVIQETGELALIRQLGRQEEDAAERSELLASYLNEHYGGTLTKEAFVPQPDPTVALLELSIASADRVATTLAGFEYEISPYDLLFDLPSVLLDEELSSRRAPFYWALPYTNEIESRFVLPAGFAVPTLPPDEKRELGAGATYATQWRADGRTVVVTLRFQTGSGTVTADAVNDLRDELIELVDEPVTVRLGPEAFALAAARKSREALASLEAVVRAHPKVLVHRQRLAYWLVSLTLGTAARQVARDAVKLAPTDPDAHVLMGSVLEYDRFGRRHGAGWDRTGAIAAFAKARKLDPTHVTAASEHGRVLLLGENGRELEDGAQPAAAAEAWGAAFALDDKPASGEAYAFALLHARRFMDALAVLEALPASTNAVGLRVAALAMSAPTADVQKAIDAIESDRDASLDLAVRELVRLREWSTVRSLAARHATVATARVVTGLPQLTRVPPWPVKSKDPIVAVKRVLDANLLVTSNTSYAWDKQTADELTRADGIGAVLGKLTSLFGSPAVRDIVFGIVTANSIGEPGGPWRVEIAVGNVKHHYFVALDRGQAKVVGASGDARGVGRHVLRLVKQGSLDEAGQLVEWLASSSTSERTRGLTTGLPRTEGSLDLVGRLLSGETAGRQPLFERCRDDANRTAELRKACGREVDSLIGKQVMALAQRGKGADADALLTTIGDPDRALRVQMDLAAARQDLAGAAAAAEALLARAPSAMMQNQLAWILYVQGGDLVRALELANAAVGRDPAQASRSDLNTRAAILAEMDRYDLAQEDLTQSHTNGRRRDERADTFVYARIAERLGYAAEAKRLYREAAKGTRLDPLSADMLAKQRL